MGLDFGVEGVSFWHWWLDKILLRFGWIYTHDNGFLNGIWVRYMN